jgi:hypothetical protein
MHTGITDNRQLILADRKAASTTRVHVSHIRERIDELDRSIGNYVYETTERINTLE